jgi:acyl-CoA ligase (AMP-forming) (exosortase A-associated)
MAEPENTAALLQAAAEAWPDKMALIDTHEALRYADLLDRATRHARRLQALGLTPGARVAVLADKSVEAVAFLFGCFMAGSIAVPVNPRLKRLQVDHILADSDAVLLAVLEGRGSFHETVQHPGLGQVVLRPGAEPDMQLDGWTGTDPARSTAPSADPKELATLFYTSGSTGLPKAVMCRHENLCSGARSVVSYLQNTEADRILAILPLSFDAGFSQLTTGFLSGATVVLRDYVLPADLSRACDQHEITGLTGVPAIYKAALSARWQDAARHRLRYFANTGGHLPEAHVQKLRDQFPAAAPFLMYGLTEAFRSTYLDPAQVSVRPGSIGKAIPGARVVVVDEAGEECAPGEVGELVHAGPTVAAGYWKSPEATARRFRPPPPCLQREGFSGPVVYSGDMVRRDAEGFLYFVSRTDRQIKILGNRVSLAEIENTALLSDAITACAAGTIAGEAGGDPTIVLFYTCGQDPEAGARLEAWCRSELPSFMVPGLFLRRDDLLLNPNGKYDVDAMLAAHLRPEPVGA